MPENFYVCDSCGCGYTGE